MLSSVLALLILSQPAASACTDAADCRAQALAAATRGDYETFHDLAWRTIQKSKPNDPASMYLLARAQALSGRFGDALVMLGRITDPLVAREAVTSDDFKVVRLLPAWAALEAKLTGNPAAPDVAPPAPAPSAPPAPLAPSPAPSAPSRAPSAPSDSSFAFSAPDVVPIGLAHDSVSRRFVLGDRKARRLLVIDEISHHVVTYVSATTAGFYDDLAAFTIDSRRGDLWVVSNRGEAEASTSVLHKLQLVSGRTLFEARTPDADVPVHFTDVTVTSDGTVYAVDAIDSRIFRMRADSRTLEPVMRLEVPRPTAMTAADDRTLYVAGAAGVVRVDLVARTITPVKSAEPLTDFDSLSWRGGSLIGVERVDGKSLIVRVPLDGAGTRAQPRAILASSPEATVGALTSGAYYYLSAPGVIQRIPLR
jgi:hypothetical protein